MATIARGGVARWLHVLGASVACFVARPAQAALVVDDFEDGDATNALGGPWTIVTDGYSTSSGFSAVSPGYHSAFAGHFTYSLVSGASYSYVQLVTFLLPSESTAGMDLSAYDGVRFVAKGTGHFTVQLATTAASTQDNFFQSYITTPADWTPVQVPFASLGQVFGTTVPWDPKTVYAIVWQSDDGVGGTGELFVDDVEFYTAAEATPVPTNNPIAPLPKVNQLGYLPASDKTFRVTVGAPAQPGDPFAVLDAVTGQSVASGTLSTTAVDDQATSGESVLSGDFSTLTAPGRYVVSVDGAQSHPFAVGDDVYSSLFRDAIRAFYIIRCGVAIDDAETGIQHPACHTVDAALRDDPSQSLDLTGGWHNAGDFGKWTHEAAISASYMMWLYELNPRGAGAINTGIPESNDAVPDLLDEARWGLRWLLKMQQPDGSVLHKVDTEPNFAWGLSPDKDPNTRTAGLASTIDAADFAAVMLQASRVFAPIDAAFSATCMSAANKAWAWVQANPSVGQTDIYYTDSDPSQEVLWALGEMTRATHDPALTQQFAASVQSSTLTAVDWMTPELFGYVSVALDPRVDPALKQTVASKIGALTAGYAGEAAASGYGVARLSSEYYWESNEDVLGRAAAMIFEYAVTGDDSARRAALQQLDWLLGRNSLDRAFVTGHGTNPIAHPYHWTYHALGKVMPGWSGGGPNSNATGADGPLIQLIGEGTPPAKCYLDEGDAAGSYASNEDETVENAALAFATGYFVPASAAGPAPDAGAATQGAPPASPEATRGCGCATSPRGARGALIAALGLVGALARRRRRRTASGAR